MQGREAAFYGSTRKGTLLESVPLGVTTWTSPLLAPAGAVAVISVPEFEETPKAAGVPLNVTMLAPVRLVPRIVTRVPTFPAAGRRCPHPRNRKAPRLYRLP